MNLKCLPIVYFLGITTIAIGSQFELAKKELMKKYDAIVEAEKTRFLNQYRLKVGSLDNHEAIRGIKTTHNEMCRQRIDFYKSQNESCQRERDALYKVAYQVFKEANLNLVAIFHDESFGLEDICVFDTNDDNSCYVVLNASQQVKNLDMLTAVLRHESCHIVNQDNFNKELMQCIAWVNSKDEHEEVAQKSYSFCRAFETRADVYAAVNSPDHGQALIEFLRLSSKQDEVLTHPKPETRLALLKQVKSILDEAKKRDAG